MVRIHQGAPSHIPLPTPLRPVATACLLAGVTLLLYGYSIRTTALTADERVFATQSATAFAARPMFFHTGGEQWLQPLAVYAGAALKQVGAGDAAGRVAGTVLGALNVVLVFLVARMLFARTSLALCASLLLLLTPAHWWHAQLGTDAIFPVPFVLLWMLATLRYFQYDAPLMLALAGLSLGVGVYAHPVAPLTMAALWLVTASALAASRRLTVRGVLMLAAGFGIALVPAAVWFVSHPETYPDTFGRWALLKAHARFPLEGLRAQINWNTLSTRASLFWGFLDPSFLFFASPGRLTAPFLLCSLVLVPLGILRTLSLTQPGHRVVLIAAALVPALVASTFGRPQDLSMAVVMPAAAALLAAIGVESLASRHRAIAWIAAACAAISAYQLVSLI